MPQAFKSIALSIVAQTVAFAAFLASIDFFIPLGPPRESSTLFPLLFSLCAASGSAYIVAHVLKLSTPWRLLNFFFPFAAVIVLSVTIPTWVFLLVALLVFTLYLPALFSQVPFFPTSEATIKKLLQHLPSDRPFSFVDLGCGFGEPLFSLAKARPLGRFTGVDLSPLSITFAWIRSLFSPNVTIRLSNIWTHNIASYDVVYAFLAPPPMTRLEEKASREMKKGSLLISNSFEIPGKKALEVAVDDARQHTLYLYQRE